MNRNDTTSTVRFGDMVHNINERILPEDAEGLPYVGLEHLDPESLKIRRWGTPDEVEAQKLRFYTGDIIFGKRRYYQKKLAVADFDGICSAHAMVLRAKSDVVLPEFLPFFMQSEMFFERAMAISVGSLSPTINWSTLAKQEFPLPPLDEQRRIAEILWAVEDAINEYQSTQSHLESYRDIFTARSMHGSIEHDEFQDSKIGLIPSSWKLVELQNVADVIYGLTVNPTSRNLPIKSPYLRVANVMRGYLSLEEVKEIGVTEDDVKYTLQSGDVLVVEGHADVFEIGRAAIWEDQISNCLHQNHILRARCTGAVSPYFLLAYINSPRGRSYFRRMAQSTSGLNTINSTVLKKMPLPLPSMEEQLEIVDRLREIEIRQSMVSKHIDTVIALKTQLLQGLLHPESVRVAHV